MLSAQASNRGLVLGQWPKQLGRRTNAGATALFGRASQLTPTKRASAMRELANAVFKECPYQYKEPEAAAERQ